MNDSDTPKPKRRWYQFRVRTLVLFVAVAGQAAKRRQANGRILSHKRLPQHFSGAIR